MYPRKKDKQITPLVISISENVKTIDMVSRSVENGNGEQITDVVDEEILKKK